MDYKKRIIDKLLKIKLEAARPLEVVDEVIVIPIGCLKN